MLITLGSNIASLRTQRQLASSSKELSGVFERLASGQRINRASDDAAGLAIAESLNAGRRIFTQGIRNINDGISLVTIADSAIENLSFILIRMEELAAQAANGSFSSTQRKALNQEAQALKQEFSRIVQSTKFNGLALLDGSLQEVALQGGVGINAVLSAGVGGALGSGSFSESFFSGLPGGQISADFNGDGHLDLLGSTGTAMGVSFGNGSGGFSAVTTFLAGSFLANVGDVNSDGRMDIVISSATSQTSYLNSGNGTFTVGYTSPITADLGSEKLVDTNGDGKLDIIGYSAAGVTTYFGDGTGRFGNQSTLSIAGVQQMAVGDINSDGIDDLVLSSGASDWVSSYLGRGDGTFTVHTSTTMTDPSNLRLGDVNGDGALDLVYARSVISLNVLLGDNQGGLSAPIATAMPSALPISDINLGDFNGDGLMDVAISQDDVALGEGHILLGSSTGALTLTQSFNYPNVGGAVAVGDLNGDGALDLIIGKSSGSASILLNRTRNGINPILPFSLENQGEALQALPLLKRKREKLAEQRGQLGAYMSRLDTAVKSLGSTVENYALAESRFRDADLADESSRLTRIGILQQAGSAVLAQANVTPSLALRLLNT